MGNYSTAYYSAVALANDMKHIHIHAKGTLLDNIHNICNEYYEKANDEADTLADLRSKTNDPSVESLLDDMARYWKK